MSTTVRYKGNTLATAENQTKVLKTAGKYMEDDVTITDVSQGAPVLQTKSVTPSETAQAVTADTGYDGLEEVDVAAVSSTYVGTGITRRSSSDLTVSGATVNVPAGYYASQGSKAVASGTEGTPTATKGTVSNHSVTVTPSVTNTAGYIQGGTKTGTGVSVTASELVSGNKSITENGTNIDVTDYETVSVNVSGGGGSSYTPVVSQEFTVSTTSTSAQNIGTIQAGSSAYTSDKILYIRVRDKAGPRDDHYLGGDFFLENCYPVNGSSNQNSSFAGQSFFVNENGKLGFTASSSYGVIPNVLKSDGQISMRTRYNSVNTHVIDGTFKVDVYLLDFVDNVAPWDGFE